MNITDKSSTTDLIQPTLLSDNQTQQKEITALETVLAGIWANHLTVEQVGVDDNFFELGGQSIDAIEIISEIRDIFQVSLYLNALNVNPTVSGLAQSLTKNAAQKERVETIASLVLETIETER